MAVKADLAAAREALEHGSLGRALQLAWSAAISSITSDDLRLVNDVIEIAEAIRARSDGRQREEAARLATYAAYARDHPQVPRWFGVTRRPT